MFGHVERHLPEVHSRGIRLATPFSRTHAALCKTVNSCFNNLNLNKIGRIKSLKKGLDLVMQCSRVLRVLLMAAVVHSRRVKHLGSATIVLSLSLSVQHNLAPFQRGKLLVLAVILENLAYIQLDIYLQNSIFFFSFSFDILSSISSFLLLTHFCGFFLFVSRPSSLLMQRLSSNQLVDTASDVADIVRLSVRRVDPVFELDLERKLPFVDHVISGWPVIMMSHRNVRTSA